MSRAANILSPGALFYAHDEDGRQCWRHPVTHRVAQEIGEGQYAIYEAGDCGEPGCEGNHLTTAGMTADLQAALDWVCGFDRKKPH